MNMYELIYVYAWVVENDSHSSQIFSKNMCGHGEILLCLRMSRGWWQGEHLVASINSVKHTEKRIL